MIAILTFNVLLHRDCREDSIRGECGSMILWANLLNQSVAGVDEVPVAVNNQSGCTWGNNA